MTESKPSVVEAIALVMSDVRAVKKREKNDDQKYLFRGIDAVVNAVGPALRQHGVIVVPQWCESKYRDVQTSRGKPSRECTVMVTYRFYGPKGDYIEVMVPGEAMDFGDKGTPKAMSVALRTALLQALCLPTDEPDADSHSYERSVVKEQRTNGDAVVSKQAEPTVGEVKRQIWAYARELEWDQEALAADYHDRYGNQELSNATLAQLVDFREALKRIVNMGPGEAA